MIKRYFAALLAIALLAPAAARAQSGAFNVDASVALSSLISLADGHIRTTMDLLSSIARTEEARSMKWERIRPLFAQAETISEPAVFGFAKPDGTFWTLRGGRQTATISDRPFFKEAMSGRQAIAEVTISRSTGKPVAACAVPIFDAGARVIGVLGASIYLDTLSATIAREMGLRSNDLFFSMDGKGVVGINSNPSIILLEPRTVSDELNRSFTRMLAHSEGTESYTFRGKARTVIYKKSAYTNWWYAFGIVR